jgi:molybdopterin converting factor small subunit
MFASLRDLAGDRVVDVPGASVEELLRAAGERYGKEFESIARAGSVVVNGERADLGSSVSEEDDVAFLPPFSGGAESGPQARRTGSGPEASRRPDPSMSEAWMPVFGSSAGRNASS